MTTATQNMSVRERDAAIEEIAARVGVRAVLPS
jgi:hypothetical protein